jgi:hypothetical protein
MSDVATVGRRAPPPIMPGALLCTIPQGAAMICRGQTFMYDGIARGLFEAVKSDGRTLIIIESLHAYVAGLPPAKIKPAPKREPQRKRRTTVEAI